jgi:nitrous oxidase accessory protein
VQAGLVKTGPAAQLQSVLDKAQPGDTILLAPGTYRQYEIVIRKPLTLIGENYPVFDGGKKHQVFIVAADHVSIQGITVQHTGRSSLVDMAGIRLQQVKHAQVRNCRFINTTYAVYLQNSSHCTVSGNQVKADATDELQSGNGVHAWKCDNLLVSGNDITGHRDGIYFEFVTASHVYRNNSYNNIRYGLHFMFSHNDTYSYNTFSSNGAGVAVMYTKGVTMYRNTFYHNWGDAAYGILLKDISDSRILLNTFRQNTIGIFMEGSSRIQVTGNEFSGNGWAMRVQANCESNTIKMNNFIDNSFDVATNGTMMLNTYKANYWDKYDGYDLNRDGRGDVPHYPVSVYSVLSERIPQAMLLYRSFLTNMMDQAEKMMPAITPDQLRDDAPSTRKWNL